MIPPDSPPDSAPAAASLIRPRRANPETAAPRAFDWQLWFVLALALAVILPRSILISRADSESGDDEHHLRRGLMYLNGQDVDLYICDPVFGEALTALPLRVIGCDARKPMNPATTPDPRMLMVNPAHPDWSFIARARRVAILFGHAYQPTTLLLIVAIWRSILFVPLAGLVFHWVCGIYGSFGGWVAALVLIFDPNFAANIHLASTDALGAEGLAFACWFAWRCVERPTWGRVITAAVAVGIAMSIKNSAFVLPLVVGGYALLWWLRARWRPALWPGAVAFRRAFRLTCWGALVVLLTIWAADRFDFSAPQEHGLGAVRYPPHTSIAPVYDLLNRLTIQPMPAGMYISSVLQARNGKMEGHWEYLFGEHRRFGWWYYFPVVATYKVPLGIFGLWAMALLALFWRRPSFAEWSILLPAVVFSVFIAWSGVNYGFRHVLGPYLFLLMFTGRAVMPPAGGWKRWGRVLVEDIATFLILLAAVHAATFHPDYVGFINYPRHDVWLDISDQNLDYGQGMVEIRKWVDAGAPVAGGALGRQVYVRYCDWALATPMHYWLGDKAEYLSAVSPRPTSGLLVIAPRWVVGAYDEMDEYGGLRQFEPVRIIGHCALVYDMDALTARGFRWPSIKIRHEPDD
jgi:hypothetical protein